MARHEERSECEQPEYADFGSNEKLMARGGQLRCYMNMMAMNSLPECSTGFRKTFRQRLQLIKEVGFQGIQFAEMARSEELSACRNLGIHYCGSGRVNDPGDADLLARQLAENGYECATLHVGWGLESDDEAHHLIESILSASERWKIPLYIETHRATICQDIWRTVGFLRRYPQMQFNGDFSHWYTGQEMVYGGFERKLAFIQPVIERVSFLHGRIANPGCIQVSVAAGTSYYAHFEQLWTACFQAFLRGHEPDSSIYFVPELLASDIFYARQFGEQEETDRWADSLRLKQMAESCFLCATLS